MQISWLEQLLRQPIAAFHTYIYFLFFFFVYCSHLSGLVTESVWGHLIGSSSEKITRNSCSLCAWTNIFAIVCVFVFFIPCFHSLTETRLLSSLLCFSLWKSRIYLLAVNFIFIIKGCGFNNHRLYLLLERLVLHSLLWLWVALPKKKKRSRPYFSDYLHEHKSALFFSPCISITFLLGLCLFKASIPSSSRCVTHRPHAELTRDQNAARCDDRDETVALRAGRRARSSLRLTRYI